MLSKVLEKNHNRKNFHCGIEELDLYLKHYVSQDIKKRVAVCYVIENATNNVIGYYTLSSNRVDISEVPEQLSKQIRYSEIPVMIIGRLAIHSDYQGNNLGRILLIDALKRIIEISALAGSHAVIVDPINDAQRFYGKFGFIPLKDSERMYLPLKTVIDLLSK